MVIGARIPVVEELLGWLATNNVLDEPEVLSKDVPDMNDLELLLEKDVDCTQDFGSVDPEIVETWGRYHSEMAAVSFAAPPSFIDIARTGCELLMVNSDLRVRLYKVISSPRGAQTTRKVAESKSVGLSETAGYMAELHKWQAASDTYTEQPTTNLEDVNKQLLSEAGAILKVCDKLKTLRRNPTSNMKKWLLLDVLVSVLKY